MREIITLQVGRCGNQMGVPFWDIISSEHQINSSSGFFKKSKNTKLDSLKLDKANVYFDNSLIDNKYVPRSILIDSEEQVLNTIKSSKIGKLFKPDNYITRKNGDSCANIWAKGYYTEGSEMIDEIFDVLRKEMESCDSPNGINLLHSLGGGTGSGLGCLCLTKFRDEYPNKLSSAYSIYPANDAMDIIVAPINAELSINSIIENSDASFVIDNPALWRICKSLGIDSPNFNQTNWIIGLLMSGITASLRFPGLLNAGLRKMLLNLVANPRLHFFAASFAPLFKSFDERIKTLINVDTITRSLWNPKNTFCSIDITSTGKIMLGSMSYRGKVTSYEVDDNTAKIQQMYDYDLINWIPNNFLTSIINIPCDYADISGTFLCNSTAMGTFFARQSAVFSRMAIRKLYFHWYKGEGMDEMEINECYSNVKDLITEYQDLEHVQIDLDADIEIDVELDEEDNIDVDFDQSDDD